MKFRIPLLFASISLASAVSAPLALKFTPGETLKYYSTISATETASFKGETFAVKVSGSNTMVVKVSSVSSGTAKLAISYTGAAANATATSLPAAAKKDRAKIEGAAEKSLKASLTGGQRSQTVRPNGSSTYTLPVTDGQKLTIEDGAFMMLVLPKTTPQVNVPWTETIRLPIPGASNSITIKYKLVGNATFNGKSVKKIVFSSSSSGSKTQQGITGKVSTSVSGFLLLDPVAGKLVQGEVDRSVRTTLTHPKEGTRTSEETSVQKFKKV
jgi:hypothetical protein